VLPGLFENWPANVPVSKIADVVRATGRSPADVNRKPDTGERPLAPTAFIFMRHRVRHKANEGLSVSKITDVVGATGNKTGSLSFFVNTGVILVVGFIVVLEIAPIP
jgi:hypothetical protein